MDKKTKEAHFRICEKVIKERKPKEKITLNEFLRRIKKEELDREQTELYDNTD